jgi:Tat protein translocase TatB subunit
MFGIGMPELLLILAVALIVIGPKKLPDIARALGRGLAEFRRATDDLKNTINVESQIKDTRERLEREGKIKPPGAQSEDAAPAEEDQPEAPPAPRRSADRRLDPAVFGEPGEVEKESAADDSATTSSPEQTESTTERGQESRHDG